MFWRNKRKIDFSSVSSDSRHSQKITLNTATVAPRYNELRHNEAEPVVMNNI